MKRCIAMSAALLTLGTHTAQAEPYQVTLLSALPEFNGSLREGVALYGSVDMGIDFNESMAGPLSWCASGRRR